MRVINYTCLKCPDCGHWKIKTTLTRFHEIYRQILRWHKCQYCSLKFRTVQELEDGQDYPPISATEQLL